MGRVGLILLVPLLLSGCSGANSNNDQSLKCDSIEVAEDLSAYNRLNVPEEQFVGILHDNGPENKFTTLQRYSRYSLSGRSLAPLAQNLNEYVGRQVVVIGKRYKFELEGQLIDELWAKSISC